MKRRVLLQRAVFEFLRWNGHGIVGVLVLGAKTKSHVHLQWLSVHFLETMIGGSTRVDDSYGVFGQWHLLYVV